MKFLVKAKAWQLFLIVAGGMAPASVMWVMHEVEGTPSLPTASATAAGLGWAYVWIFGWLWTLGTQLNRKTRAAAPSRTRLFRLSLAWLTANLLIFLSLFVAQGTADVTSLSLSSTGGLVLLGSSLIGGFSWCYAVYFVTKTLMIARVYNDLTRLQHAGLFLLVWLFPAGVWFIQPRVNAIFESDEPVHA